jgi:hypothetical protein
MQFHAAASGAAKARDDAGEGGYRMLEATGKGRADAARLPCH